MDANSPAVSEIIVRAVTEFTADSYEDAREKQERLFRILTDVGGYAVQTEILDSRIEYSEYNPENLSESILDTKITDILPQIDDYKQSAKSRLTTIFGYEGIETARDVLVCGRIKLLDLRNFGSLMECLVSDILAYRGIISEWKDSPSASDIAKWCTSLYQVHPAAIGVPKLREFGYINVGRILEIAQSGDDHYSRRQALAFATEFNQARRSKIR
jgi:hypothetical protein